MGQTWVELAGGIYTNPELSRRARFITAGQTRCHEVVDQATEYNIGKKSGDSVGGRNVGRLSTLGTTPLGENTPVPLDAPPIYHWTGTVYRYARGIAWSGTRADLDRLDVEDMNIRTLRDNSARTVNKIVYDNLVASRSFCYVPLTASTHAWGTAGVFTSLGAANSDWTLYHFRKLMYRMESTNIPFFDGENYAMLCSSKIKSDILADTTSNGYIDVKKYAGKAEAIFNNEFGSAFGFRFILDNVHLSNDTGTNDKGEAIVCGYEALKEIMVYPVHFRSNLNYGNDFGNQAALAWQGMFGYKAPWNYTTHGDGRIVHIGSES